MGENINNNENNEIVFIEDDGDVVVDKTPNLASNMNNTSATTADNGVNVDAGKAAGTSVGAVGAEAGNAGGDSSETPNAGAGSSGGMPPADNGGNSGNSSNSSFDGNDSEDKKVDPVKVSFNKGLVIGIGAALGGVLIIGLVAAAFVFGVFPTTRTYKNAEASSEDKINESAKLDMDRVEAKMEMLQDLVSEEYLFDIDPEQLEEGVYKGYMSGLGDKYSQYYSAEEFQKLSSSMEGVFYGIGATVQKDEDTGIVTVVNVIPDSPAEKAGVKDGDIIFAVGDTEATDIDLDTLVYDLIRGEKGTDVTITFVRDGEKLDITITRGEVKNTTVYSELMDGNIGYIEVSQFTDETVPQFKAAVDDMIEQGAKGLVIDLRNNTGGVLLGAVEMLDYMLPDGVKEHEGMLVYTANKNGVGERYFATDKHEIDIPVVILVNGYSASASEVFTGAMMDYDAATVVGTQTFGKGIVQTIRPLSDGSAVKMTVEHYYTPDGTDLHGEGLTPDHVIELDKECKKYTDEHDNQYAKAVEIINEKTK